MNLPFLKFTYLIYIFIPLREIWVLVAVHGSTNSLIAIKNFKIGA